MIHGQPWSNGYIESFNGHQRDECLNINSFWPPPQDGVVISDWKDKERMFRRASDRLGPLTFSSLTPARFSLHDQLLVEDVPSAAVRLGRLIIRHATPTGSVSAPCGWMCVGAE